MPKLSKSTSQFLFSNKIKSGGDQSYEDHHLGSKNNNKVGTSDDKKYKELKDDFEKAESSTPLKTVPKYFYERKTTRTATTSKNVVTPTQGHSGQQNSRSKKFEVSGFKESADSKLKFAIKRPYSIILDLS